MNTRRCVECGKMNKSVRLVKEFEKILCETCYKTYKYNPVKYIPPNGEIHYDDEGKVICHICGRSYDKLTIHLLGRHKISQEKYKEMFELNRGQSLISKKLLEVYKKNKNTANIYKYRVTFKKGHKNAQKPKRLQCRKNRTGMTYNSKNKKGKI